jgi:hypothetical protein
MKTNRTQLNGRQLRITSTLPQLCSIALVLVAMVMTGCTQHAMVSADVNPTGKYALVSVDGNNVPCNVQHQGHDLPVQSGSFVINSDGTCSSRIVLSGAKSAIEVKATYTLEGSKLTMKWQGAGMTTGAVQGDTFTMSNEGMIFSYRREG